VQQVPENGNVVIAFLGVEPVPSAHRPPGDPQYLSVHRGFPHQPVTVHERHVHPARISRNFSSSTFLVDCRGRGGASSHRVREALVLGVARIHPRAGSDVQGTDVYGVGDESIYEIDHLLIDKISGRVVYR
jgi:hypothetical protein